MRHDLLRIELILALGRGPWLALVLKRLAFVLATEQLLASLAEELAAPLRCAQALGQLIPTRLPELFILGLVRRPDLGEDLHRDLIEPVVDLPAGVSCNPRPVDRHHPRLHQPCLLAEL